MAYSLSTHFAGAGLLDRFSFFTGKDPSNGFVDWQSREDALAKNLVSIDEFNRVKLGVDSINTYSVNDTGRPSVKITSNDVYTHGLFIADFAHLPGSTCGTWPLFMALSGQKNGTRWPTGGEIDIVEGANTAQRNLITAHTIPGCRGPNNGFTGAQGFADCSLSPGDIGCNFAAPTSDTTSYGDAFNAEGGGIYALEWDSSGIRVWHFPRSAVPKDISLAPLITPDPTTWGPPQALFGGSSCDTDTYFSNMSLAISTNFCGAYAGGVWGVADQCSLLAPTCEEYVAGHPRTFNNAFWKINYIDVYQKPGSALNNSTIPLISPNNTIPDSVTSTTTVIIPSGTRTITISTFVPTPTGGGLPVPASINGWTRLGCFSSLSGYETFDKAAKFAAMDNEACVASCAGRRYAGVSGDSCYCADTIGRATAVENSMCDVPCPGDANEVCGGILTTDERANSPSFVGMGVALTNGTATTNGTTASRHNNTNTNTLSSPSFSLSSRLKIKLSPIQPRSAPSNVLLTIYGNTFRSSSSNSSSSSSSSSDSGSGSSPFDIPPGAPGANSGGKGEVVALTHTVTVTFTTICPTNSAQLITLEYCTALTTKQLLRNLSPTPEAPNIVNAIAIPTAQIPMTTVTQSCASCGVNGSSIVTLTIPQAVAEGTGEGEVISIALQTVVPLYNYTYNSPSTSVPVSSTSPVESFVAPVIPLMGASAGAGAGAAARGFVTTLVYGVMLWFVVFWVGVLV